SFPICYLYHRLYRSGVRFRSVAHGCRSCFSSRCRMGRGLDRLSPQRDVPSREIVDEVIPLAADQDAPQLEDELGALAPPAHSGTVQAHGDDVADGTLDGSRADV